MNKDKSILREAAITIKDLRHENANLRARLSGFDDALLLLRSETPRMGGGECKPDIVYGIEKRIEQMEAEENPTNEAYAKRAVDIDELARQVIKEGRP